jgi:hypothetical protein
MAAVEADLALPAHFADAAALQVKPPITGDGPIDAPEKGRSAKPHKAAMVNGTGDEYAVLYEKKVNGSNGTSLTSVKPPDDYEDALALDELEKRGHRQLISGRKPSAGWERSGCVDCSQRCKI